MPILKTYIVPHPPLLVPEVGKGRENMMFKTKNAMNRVSREISELEPDTIIYITPHSANFSNYFHILPDRTAFGNFSEFGVDDIDLSTDLDERLLSEICYLSNSNLFPAGILGDYDGGLDYGVTVPMYFINQRYTDYKSIIISVSDLSFEKHYELGSIINRAIINSGLNVVIVASGNLSDSISHCNTNHRYSTVFDKKVCDTIKSGDLFDFLSFTNEECEAVCECGMRSFLIMSGALNNREVDARLLSYEAPFGTGYAVGSFTLVDTVKDDISLLRDHILFNKVTIEIRTNKK